MKFIRYGSLAAQKHEINPDEDERGFHTALVEWGFYAFPKGYVEGFLLGGVGSGSLQNGRWRKMKDASGKPIKGLITDFKYEEKSEYGNYNIWEWKSEWTSYFKKHKIKETDVRLWALKSRDMDEARMAEGAMQDVLEYYLVVENKPNIFEYEGHIWSHIDSYYVRLGVDKDLCSSSSKEKFIIKPKDILKKSGSWVLTDIKTYERALETYVKWIRYDATKMNVYSNRGNHPLSCYSKDEFEVFIESL